MPAAVSDCNCLASVPLCPTQLGTSASVCSESASTRVLNDGEPSGAGRRVISDLPSAASLSLKGRYLGRIRSRSSLSLNFNRSSFRAKQAGSGAFPREMQSRECCTSTAAPSASLLPLHGPLYRAADLTKGR